MSGRILIGENSATHVCLSFTRQMRVGQHEKKLGECIYRDKFDLSPTVGQQVVSFTHANLSWPTQVGQQKFVV